MKTIRVRPPSDGCVAGEIDSLRKSGYVDGPIVCAVLDFARWPTFAAWERHVLKDHGDGTGYRLRRAAKAGVTVKRIERENWLEDWTEIDLSKPKRQGREMTPHYRRTLAERGGAPTTWKADVEPTCHRHWRMVFGAFVPNPAVRVVAGRETQMRLVGYVSLIRTDALLVNSARLGHAEWLKEGVMPALYRAIAHARYHAGDAWHGIDAMLYAGWDSGTSGLREFKQRLGFEAARLVSA